MDIQEFDLPETPPIRGNISRAWRCICHKPKHRADVQARARRKVRRAVRQAIQKGNARDLPQSLDPWDVW